MSCNHIYVVSELLLAGESGEPAEALRDRRPSGAARVAGQAAGLHGGPGHAHHPVSHHLKEPARPLPAIPLHQG